MLLLAVMPAMAEEADAMTSASASYFYGDSNLTGDSLMDVINSFSVLLHREHHQSGWHAELRILQLFYVQE